MDLYQVHWPDPNTPLEETFTALSKIVESGKVRYVGVSNYSPEQMEEASKYCEIVSLQPPYSLLQREIEDEVLPYCIEKGIGVLSYGSIGAGALTGKFKTRPISMMTTDGTSSTISLVKKTGPRQLPWLMC